MATTSIIKEYIVKDQKAFERMKQDLYRKAHPYKMATESAFLKKSKEKLAPLYFVKHGQISRFMV